MSSNAASDNAMNRLDPRFLTTDHRRQTTQTPFCGQWSVVGGQTNVQVTDKSRNDCGIGLWLSRYKFFVCVFRVFCGF